MSIGLRIFLMFLLLLHFRGNVCSQWVSARSDVYDRGLISTAEPFSSTGNPALLTARDFIRFNIEYYRNEENGYQISMSYPLSEKTGLGLAWRRFGEQQTRSNFEGLVDQDRQRQDFVLSFGHNTGIVWGQYFEFNFENFQRRTWLQANSEPSMNYQQFCVQYRLGLYRQLGKSISIGILTPPIVAYTYQTFGDKTDSTSTWTQFGEETNVSTSVPIFAVELALKDNLKMALSNRSFQEKSDMQLAVQWLHSQWDVLQAIRYHNDNNHLSFLSGMGISYQGFEIFTGYNFSEKHLTFAASFTPERMITLVRMKDIRMGAYQLYPYRLRCDQPAYLALFLVERISGQPVEINLVLSGDNLPTMTQSVSFGDGMVKEIPIAVPENFLHLPPGRYIYNVEMTAYAKGKQKLASELVFEMKSNNDWSGEPKDLVYFINPQNQNIFNQSRRLISKQNFNPQVPAEETARQFYQFLTDSIRYVPDPRPLHHRSDRGQYPSELLKSKTGDCEDFAILMISMLQSVGIDASFVEYVRPDTDQGHIFIMFDSQQNAAQLIQEGRNLQKYIVRNQRNKSESKYFIPLELTRKDLSFEASWVYALELYQTLGIHQNGLVDDWFHIIDAR